MCGIIPFCGIRYNQEKISSLETVVAPPYDEISHAQQEELYQRDPYNIVRLILGREYPEDGSQENKYLRSARQMGSWLEAGILMRDAEPSLYIYEQRYRLAAGEQRRRRGFIALAKLEDFSTGKILPHEFTLAKPKQDRLDLLRATQAQLSQVFAFYSDPQRTISQLLETETAERSPAASLTDDNGDWHGLWQLSEREKIAFVCQQMDDKAIFIADGHHRYETGLTYQKERRAAEGNSARPQSYDYIPMMFVNMDESERPEDNLTILPIHRLIRRLSCFSWERIRRQLELYFQLETLEFSDSSSEGEQRRRMFSLMAQNASRHSFGVYCGGNSYDVLTLRDKEAAELQMGDKYSRSWKALDVAVLQTLLIDNMLRVRHVEWNEDNLAYTTNADQAIRMVQEQKYQLAIFLNPTRVQQVKEVAVAGEKMPQKSTFFYPKLLSGLVLNKL